jgi:hypothetical protein
MAYPKNWSTGFFPTVSFMTDAEFVLRYAPTLAHSLSLSLSLFACSPSFRSSINIAPVCKNDQ